MLSDFIKKLLFTRELEILEGEIKILSENQTFISTYAFLRLISINKERAFEILEETLREDIAIYEKRLGIKPGSYEHIQDVFGLFGIGKLKIIDLEMKEKKSLVEIHDSALPAIAVEEKLPKEDVYVVFQAVLDALFTYVFKQRAYTEIVEYYLDKPCKCMIRTD